MGYDQEEMRYGMDMQLSASDLNLPMNSTGSMKQSAVTEAAAKARREKVLKESQDRLEAAKECVKGHARSKITDLSQAVTGVLCDEMASLDRRQKEQIKSMEQVQASLKSLQTLALKVSKTCKEVSGLSDHAFQESANIEVQPETIPVVEGFD